MGKQGRLLVSGSWCLFVFTYIHIQDLMSLILFNKKLATCEGYCEEHGDQMLNVTKIVVI